MPDTDTDLANVDIGELQNTEEAYSGQIDEYAIVSSPNDFNTRTINNFIEEGAVKIPPFQRNYVWDRRRASKLVESLILGLPVPQVFLYEQDNNDFLVIDGQQRLLSIFFFIKERFPRKDKRSVLRDLFNNDGGISEEILMDDEFFEPFKLSLPKLSEKKPNKFAGLTYTNLGQYKRQFDLRTIRNIIVKQVSPDNDHSSMFEMFNRLNTGGVNLNVQEIRASLFHSPFFSELFELNGNEKWRELMGTADPDSRMKDLEIILRGLALRDREDTYSGSMNAFINKYCADAKKFGGGRISQIVSEWKWFMELNSKCGMGTYHLGNQERSGRFSPLLFEAIYTAVLSLRDSGRELQEIDPNWVTGIARDGEFVQYMHEGSTKTKNVLGRVRVAREFLARSAGV